MKTDQDNTRPSFSLIHPSDRPRQTVFSQWSDNSIADMGLEKLFTALSYSPHYEKAVKDILLELCPDTDVITYRQEILEDFLNNQNLLTQFTEILPLLTKLKEYSEIRSPGSKEETVNQTLGRLTELNAYLDCVRQLKEILLANANKIHSSGLKELNVLLAKTEADETFQSLSQTIPKLISRLSGIPSITIGINLDNELRPIGAMLLSVNEKPFIEGSLLEKLTGRKNGKGNLGIGPLHEVPFEYVESLQGQIVPLHTRVDPLMVPLFQDVYKVLRSVISPITAALRQFTQIHAEFLLPLENEIAFYLGAVGFIDQLRNHGLPICRPEILPMEKRTSQMDGMYNPLLALHRADAQEEDGADMPVVLNNVDFSQEGRIFILTGPNQGGKTVYTQAVGLAQILFQAGLFVPAHHARLSPVDCIYTHFATEEKSDSRYGRLSEESIRLNEIFKTLTEHSLVLLNESLSSTSANESLYLARDIVRALRLFEARAIFATHLHELAEDLDVFNTEGTSDSTVVSLVAGVELEDDLPEPEEQVVPRTYQIKPGPPRGVSYAKGIAYRFGISFEQLASLQRDKGETVN